MSTSTASYGPERIDESIAYRPLSSGAVASTVIGVLSVLCVLAATNSLEACFVFSALPVTGLWLGLRSLSAIRRAPRELAGARLALAGAILSAGFLFVGLGIAGYVYATEVPEGYDRITFAELQPDDRLLRQGVLVPQETLALEGRKVFIRGYMRPSSQQYGLDEFLLVRDNNQCCFGAMDQVKYHDRILVTLVPPRRIDYGTQAVRVGGILHVAPENAMLGSEYPVFTLKADYIR